MVTTLSQQDAAVGARCAGAFGITVNRRYWRGGVVAIVAPDIMRGTPVPNRKKTIGLGDMPMTTRARPPTCVMSRQPQRYTGTELIGRFRPRIHLRISREQRAVSRHVHHRKRVREIADRKSTRLNST